MPLGQFGGDQYGATPTSGASTNVLQQYLASKGKYTGGSTGREITAPGDPNATAQRFDSRAQYPAAAAQKSLFDIQSKADRTGELLDSLGIERPDSLAELQEQGYQDNEPSTFERVLMLIDGPRQAINLGIQDFLGGNADPGLRDPTAGDYLDALTGGMKDKEQFQAETGLRPESGSHSLGLLGWDEIDNVDGIQPSRLLRGIADFAFQVVTDPLSYITFGASGIARRALGEAGSAIVKSQADNVIKAFVKGTKASDNAFISRYATRADDLAKTLVDDVIGEGVPAAITDPAAIRRLVAPKVQAHIEREMANEIVSPLIGRKFGELSEDVLELLPAFARGGTRFSVPFLGVKSLKKGIQIPGTRGLGKKALGDPIRDVTKAMRKKSKRFDGLAKVVENVAVRSDGDKAFLRSIARAGENDLEGYHWLLVRDAIANKTGRQNLAIAASRLNATRHKLYEAGRKIDLDPKELDQMLVHFRSDYGGGPLAELLGDYAGKDPELVGLVQEFAKLQNGMIDQYFETLIDLDPTMSVDLLRDKYLPLVTSGDGQKVVAELSDVGAAFVEAAFTRANPEENFGAFIVAHLLDSYGFGGTIEGSLGSSARMMDRKIGNTVVTLTDGDPLMFVDREVMMAVKDRRALELQGDIGKIANSRAPLSPAEVNDIIEPHVLKFADEHNIRLGDNGGRLFEEDPFQLTVDYMRQMDNAIVQRRIISTMEEAGMVVKAGTQIDAQNMLVRVAQGLQADTKFAQKAASRRLGVLVDADEAFDPMRANAATRMDSATGALPTIHRDTLRTSRASRERHVVAQVDNALNGTELNEAADQAIVLLDTADGTYHFGGTNSTELDEFANILAPREGEVYGRAAELAKEGRVIKIRVSNESTSTLFGREVTVEIPSTMDWPTEAVVQDLRGFAGANDGDIMFIQMHRGNVTGEVSMFEQRAFAIPVDPEKAFDEAVEAIGRAVDDSVGRRADFVDIALENTATDSAAASRLIGGGQHRAVFDAWEQALGPVDFNEALRASMNLPPLADETFEEFSRLSNLYQGLHGEMDTSTETLAKYLGHQGTFGQQFEQVIFNSRTGKFVPVLLADGQSAMRNALRQLKMTAEEYVEHLSSEAGDLFQISMERGTGKVSVITPNNFRDVSPRAFLEQEEQIHNFLKMHGLDDIQYDTIRPHAKGIDGEDLGWRKDWAPSTVKPTVSAEQMAENGYTQLSFVYEAFMEAQLRNNPMRLVRLAEDFGEDIIEEVTGITGDVMRFESANLQFRENLERMRGWSREMVGSGDEAGYVVFPDTFKAVGDTEFKTMMKEQAALARELGFVDPELFGIKAGDYAATSIKKGFVNPHRFAVGGAALQGKQVQRDLALWFEQLTRNMQAVYTPMGIAQLKQTTNSVIGWWKGMATITRPSFHVRNLIGGVWNNQIIGVGATDYLKVRNGAMGIRKVLRKGGTLEDALEQIADPDTQKMFRAAWESGVLDVSFSRTEFRGLTKENRSLAEKVVGFVNPFDKEDFALIRGGAFMMESVEDFLRLSAFSAWFDPTDLTTAQVAKEMALAVHFDYTNLTELETGIKKLVPFFVWARRNIPLQAQTMLERPGLMNRYSHMMQSLDDSFPPIDEEQFPGSQYNTGYAAGTDLVFNEGTPFWARAIIDPDLPIRDLLDLDPLHPSQMAEHMSGLLGPHITLPFDLMNQSEWGDVNAPAGLSEVARSLAAFGLYDKEKITPQGDAKIPYWARTLYNTAFPFAREINETLLPPNDPRHAQSAGQLPGGDTGTNFLTRLGLTAAKGLGVKTVTPANTRSRTYEANTEIDNILDGLRQSGQIQPTEDQADDIRRYSMFSSGR